mmetsp:Transcript_56430/g.164985  ORF Transcript_56430/g.164985 Transcript_56430/m.164985 type:complete len:332 (-) Transcript_56430:571-1566(-)
MVVEGGVASAAAAARPAEASTASLSTLLAPSCAIFAAASISGSPSPPASSSAEDEEDDDAASLPLTQASPETPLSWPMRGPGTAAMSASKALAPSSSAGLVAAAPAAAFPSGGPHPLPRGRFAGGSAASASGIATSANASAPRCRTSSANSSKSSIAVAPGPSRSAVLRGSLSVKPSKSAQEVCGIRRPRAAISLRQVTKSSRRFRSSRYAEWSGCSFDFASASCSETCLKSRREAQTRKASSGGSSSWSSSRFTRMALASVQRKRVRLSSGSEAMRRCNRTTRSVRLSARALRCFSSRRSMTDWKTSSLRTSERMHVQASSLPSCRAASS